MESGNVDTLKHDCIEAKKCYFITIWMDLQSSFCLFMVLALNVVDFLGQSS